MSMARWTIGLVVGLALLGTSTATATTPKEGWYVMVQHRTSLTDDNPTMSLKGVKAGDTVRTPQGIGCVVNVREGYGSLICQPPDSKFTFVADAPNGATLKAVSRDTGAYDSIILLDGSKPVPGAPEGKVQPGATRPAP